MSDAPQADPTTPEMSDEQAEIWLQEEHGDDPKVAFLSRTYWAWLDGGLANLASSTAQDRAEQAGLKVFVEEHRVVEGFDPIFRVCQQARAVEDDEWLVGFMPDAFMMTNRAIYVLADRKTSGRVEVVLLDQLAEYFTKGSWRYRLTFKMRDGQVLEIGPADGAPQEEFVDEFKHGGPSAVTSAKGQALVRGPAASEGRGASAPSRADEVPALVRAAGNGKLPKVQRMLKDPEHLASAPAALHAAVAAGKTDVARAIIKAGVPADTLSEEGSTALATAGLRHDLPMVIELIDRGARPDATNGSGQTVVGLVREGGFEYLASALERASNPEAWRPIKNRLSTLVEAEGVVEVKADGARLAFPSTDDYVKLRGVIASQGVQRLDQARLHEGKSFAGGVADEALEWTGLEAIAAKHDKLAPYYAPIATLARRGILFGALTGMGLKLLDTTATFLMVGSPMGLAMVLLIASFLIAKWVPIAPALAGGFAGITGGLGFFAALLSSAAVGAALGAPGGAFVGGIVGIVRSRGTQVAPDREPEQAMDIVKWVVVPAILFAGAVYAYVWLLLPWLITRLEAGGLEG